MSFKIGDKVRFLNEVGEGVIHDIIGERYVVADEHGFEWEMSEDEIVADASHLDKEYNRENPEMDFKRAIDLPRVVVTGNDTEMEQYISKQGKKTYLEIDLHIQELVNHISHLSTYEIVTIQVNRFMQFFKLAKKERYQKLIVIHGLGQGVLKSEIRAILDAADNCTYRDADFKKYGLGATEITLWYN